MRALYILPLLLLSALARADCDGTGTDDDVVLEHVRQGKKISPVGWKTDGFFYLFSMNGSDVYIELSYQGGMSGEPVYTGAVYVVDGDNVRTQCLNEVGIGNYKFKAQPKNKTFTISASSGCNDHSGEDCEPVTEKYRYVWNGLAFYTAQDIALSKSNLNKLLAAIRKKDQKAISVLIKQPAFYPALSEDDVDDAEGKTYFQFEKSKAATFAVMSFEVRETLKALKAGEDPVRLSGTFSEIAKAVFNGNDTKGEQRRIFPADQAYTQLINDIGFTYQQLWEHLLELKPRPTDPNFTQNLGTMFEGARAWLESARSRDPQRAVVYLNLSDLWRVCDKQPDPKLKEEPEALLRAQCYASKYTELMSKTKLLSKKIPPELTKFLGDKSGIASQPECKKFFL
jgi:hypothetical protein